MARWFRAQQVVALFLFTPAAQADWASLCSKLLNPARTYRVWQTMAKAPLFFRELYTDVESSRQDYNIRRLSDPKAAVPRGHVVIFMPTNCAPCMEATIQLNSLSRKHSDWLFNNHDYASDWHGQAGNFPKVIVQGMRKVHFPLAMTYPAPEWFAARLAEATQLAMPPGPDLVWHAHNSQQGEWVEAGAAPDNVMAKDLYSDFERPNPGLTLYRSEYKRQKAAEAKPQK